ncbi:hypothetical protein RND81_02G094400 [Saponaria officinalis]|uniref:Glycine--tRNA ligase n=1 Tax=Saponaria officinalis TaxID=3572 RepID=A0AAW1MKZ2_SAPOF
MLLGELKILSPITFGEGCNFFYNLGCNIFPRAVNATVESLKVLKREKAAAEEQLRDLIKSSGGESKEEFRQGVINTLERRLFHIPSFKIYRGVAGSYDYGPPGCSVKSNVLAFWR